MTEQLYAIEEITFANNGDLLVGTASGSDGPTDGVFRSSDGGVSWAPMPMSPFNKSIYEIFVRPNGVALAGPMRSGLYRSEDDGYTFDVVWEPPYVGYVRGFADTLSGEIIGATLGGLYLSRDEGKTWAEVGQGIPASRIAAFAIDDQGYVYVGTEGAGIYRSVMPIVSSTWANEKVPQEHYIRPAIPNPFRDETTITFVLDRMQVVQVSIFDVIGREIAVLADGPFTAGEHRVTWRPEHLVTASGRITSQR